MKKIQIKKLKPGQEFKIDKESETIYIMEKYSKKLKRYLCHIKDQISETEMLKKNTNVYINK